MDFLKLAFVFAAIVIALRKKVPVSVTLFSAGLMTALLFLVSLGDLLDGYWQLVTSNRFISLTSIIILITILGSLLRELGTLAKLSEACRDLYGGKRTAAAIVPPLIGLMPMPGGSLLSAPLVDTVLNEPQYPAHLKCAINYWSRHVVEHFMPIYPGIILSEAVTGMPALHLALMQSPLAIVMVTLGFIFMLRRIAPSTGRRGELTRPLVGIVRSLWPIILTILLYGLLRIDLWLAALISLLLLIVIARPNRGMISRSFKTGLTYKLIFLVFGILSFQTALEISGAIASIQRLSVEYGFPEELIIISVGFTAGLLTGMYAAFVALAYSLLAGFLYQPEINTANIFLAYLSGYLGMMLSPTHLCLVLTNEYFRSNLLSVYKILIWPALLLGLVGYLIYLSPWPSLF